MTCRCPSCGHEFKGMRIITEEDFKALKDAWEEAAVWEGK
jgi:hypothetical protein